MLALLVVMLAQAPASVQKAAQTISPEDIGRRIGIIADDSMKGRDTPSPELDKVAAYIGGEYRRFGLKPGGDRGTFIQHYPVKRVQVVADSSVAFVHGGPGATLKYGTDFVFADNTFASGDYAGDMVLVTGSLGAATADTALLAGKMVLLAMPRIGRGNRDRLMKWRPAGVIVLNTAPDSTWANIVRRGARPQPRNPSRQVGGPIFITARAASLRPVLSALGTDLGASADSTFVVKPLAGAQLHVHARIEPAGQNRAPNVVGILEGSDPRLKNEYVVFSAHMDHIGVAGRGSGQCQARGGDSICNGADDDGSGTAAVVAIAQALAGMNPRPKRSIIFLNVSGEEKGLWGSEYFANHPAVPITSIVADLNIDMIGRNWRDTIVAIGKEHSDLGATLNRIAAEHPELSMQPIDDIWPDQNFYARSDHYNFARKGVPILFFFSGTHEDYHQPGDSPDKIDTEKESRVARLIFYLGVEVANTPARPKWNPDSYRSIVGR